MLTKIDNLVGNTLLDVIEIAKFHGIENIEIYDIKKNS